MYIDAEAVKALPVTASVRKAGFSFEVQQRQNSIIFQSFPLNPINPS